VLRYFAERRVGRLCRSLGWTRERLGATEADEVERLLTIDGAFEEWMSDGR
jgi:hypothetical protein